MHDTTWDSEEHLHLYGVLLLMLLYRFWWVCFMNTTPYTFHLKRHSIFRYLLIKFGLQEDHTSQSQRISTLNLHWKDWCWSWCSNTLGTWCEELTHWKRYWCWARLKAGGGGSRGWDDWMASPARRTWIKQTLGDSEGAWSPWGHKQADMI